jgi:glycosyltransferase involved in cell wall biosynthesis
MTRPLRNVLLVSYHYPPDGSSSGVLRPLKFSRYLPEFGWRPHVLTVREDFHAIVDRGLLAQIPDGARVHRTRCLDSSRHLSLAGRHLSLTSIPDRYVGWILFGPRAGRAIVRRHGIEAIWSTSPPATTHLVAGEIARTTGIPWIVDFRDPWIEDGAHPKPGTWRFRMELAMERHVLRRAAGVVATTPELLEELRRRHHGIVEPKGHVIYNGFDESDFGTLPPAAPTERFEILHAGLVTPEFRDPFPLLRAVADATSRGALRRADVRVTLLGGGSYVASPAFARAVADLGLADVVRVEGRVSHDEALRRSNAAAVLLVLQHSADTESLIPAKAFEYLRLPRPILSLTPRGATANLLGGRSECTVVDPDDAAALVTALERLYRSWDESRGAVVAARDIAAFERRRLTGELASILEGVRS